MWMIMMAMGLAEEPEVPQETPTEEQAYRVSVGTSLFVLYNLIPDPEPPGFFQLNVGYRVTPKDVISLEAITWQYHAPLGIQWGPEYGNPEHRYPGKVRDVGVGVAYQRFVWKGAYAAVHAMPFHQRYIDPQGETIQSGFQLFLTGRVGYHVPFAKKRIFIEPSVACTAWPIHTNLPDAFVEAERPWDRYFLFEPGMHVGVRL